MRQSDQIIILSTTKFGENSVILHCLSKTYGRCGVLVKSAAKHASFFQPLAILDCEVTVNPKSTLLGATAFFSAHPLSGIRSSFAKNAISMFVAEVLFRALHEGDTGPHRNSGNNSTSPEDTGLFDWCISEILLLDALKRDFANFHLRFLMDFAAALGFSPSLDGLIPFMDGGAGGSPGGVGASAEVSSAEGAGIAGTGASSAAVARAMIAGDFADTMLIRLTGAQRTDIAARILKYLEAHLETPLHIRSLPVLSELFA